MPLVLTAEHFRLRDSKTFSVQHGVARPTNGSPFGRAGNANALTERVRKSASPCRLGKRFFCPVQDRVNDKKVNEENSNFKNKGFVLSEEPLVEVHVSNAMPLLDTTYHFLGRITSPFFDFSPINVRKIAFLEKRTNSTRSSRQTDEQA